eukprot:883959-Pyramimonas_sp.AAC.1
MVHDESTCPAGGGGARDDACPRSSLGAAARKAGDGGQGAAADHCERQSGSHADSRGGGHNGGHLCEHGRGRGAPPLEIHNVALRIHTVAFKIRTVAVKAYDDAPTCADLRWGFTRRWRKSSRRSSARTAACTSAAVRCAVPVDPQENQKAEQQARVVHVTGEAEKYAQTPGFAFGCDSSDSDSDSDSG